jgi:arylsulfatase A-like enzyme
VTERPNIVLLMTDQQRADFVAGEGCALDTMPFTDGLAADGVRFRRAYTSAPLCVPARCSLLTGRFPKVTQVRQNSAASFVVRGLDLVDVLAEAGYRLNFAGKTHFYRQAGDFDSFSGPYGHLTGPAGAATGEDADYERWLQQFGHEVGTGPTPFGVECQFPYRIVSDAIAQLDKAPAGRPFFSWLSFPEPHNPYQVPEPYFSLFAESEVPGRLSGPDAAAAKGGSWQWLREVVEAKRPGYDDNWRRYQANYCGMLRLIDDQIRRFVTELRGRGLADNTIFILLADHGDYAGEYGLQRKGAGLPECLMRIPMIITGPGVVPGPNATDFVSIIDVLPTICEAVGAEIPFGVQGRSLWPLLTGARYPAEEFASICGEYGYGGLPYQPEERPALHFPYEGRRFDELNTVTQSGKTKMLRRGRWKLVFGAWGHGELYDLENDPAELHNRYADPGMATIRSSLLEELLGWVILTDDDLPQAGYMPKRAPHNWRRAPQPEPAASARSDQGMTARVI